MAVVYVRIVGMRVTPFLVLVHMTVFFLGIDTLLMGMVVMPVIVAVQMNMVHLFMQMLVGVRRDVGKHNSDYQQYECNYDTCTEAFVE